MTLEHCHQSILKYWYAIFSHLHVCPVWKNLATQDDMTEGILAGLYGYKGDVDDGRRRNLARLARALHIQFWAPPSATDVAAALAAPGSGTPPAPPPQ